MKLYKMLVSFRPNYKISVFRVTDLKILVGLAHTFFSGKKYNFMHFERHLPFKMHKIIYFSRKTEKNPRFHQ